MKVDYIITSKRAHSLSTGASSYTVKARILEDALQKLCKKCIEEDDTGIFFELENANLEELNKNKKFHTVKIKEGLFGIILEDLKEYSEGRNQYLMDMRAKRELLGLTCDDMIKLSGLSDYKDREAGHRKVTIDDYAMFMNILNDYEEESRLAVMGYELPADYKEKKNEMRRQMGIVSDYDENDPDTMYIAGCLEACDTAVELGYDSNKAFIRDVVDAYHSNLKFVDEDYTEIDAKDDAIGSTLDKWKERNSED